jgi:hypothetical protein
MPDKKIFGKFLKFFQFIYKAFGDFLVNTGLRAKDANHDRLFGLFFNRTTENRGISFVENLDDPVVIDAFSALSNFISAGRASCNILGQQLAAVLTQLHRRFHLTAERLEWVCVNEGNSL